MWGQRSHLDCEKAEEKGECDVLMCMCNENERNSEVRGVRDEERRNEETDLRMCVCVCEWVWVRS